VYAATISGTIQVPACPSRGAAHCAITSRKAVSTRVSYAPRSTDLRSDRETLSSSGKSTMRGSGDHHRIGSPSENHGKMPRE